jgi:hypothetical protein
MNTPKAIELAFAAMLRTHAELTEGTLVRPWQSLNEDGAFVEGNDRTFPCIDIRFAPDQYNEDQTTLVCIGQIAAMSRAEDDPDHQQVSGLYEAVHSVALSLFSDSMVRTTEGKYAEFVALVEGFTDSAINVGGITIEAGIPPSSDEEHTIGIGLGVHFSYAH